jgi:hypothetical protein
MSTKPQKPQRAGAMWVNVKKGASQEVTEGIAEALKFLRDNHAYFSVKMGDTDEYVAFFNGFRKSSKDPAIIVYPKMASAGSKPTYNKKPYPQKSSAYAPQRQKFTPQAAPQTESASDSFGGEEVPFL